MYCKPSSDIWDFLNCVTHEEKMQLPAETYFLAPKLCLHNLLLTAGKQ